MFLTKVQVSDKISEDKNFTFDQLGCLKAFGPGYDNYQRDVESDTTNQVGLVTPCNLLSLQKYLLALHHNF